MPTLVIKNVPEELVASLKQAAEREQRSLTGQVIALLADATGHGRLSVEDHLRRARQIHRQVDLPPMTDEELLQAYKEGRR